MGRKGEAGRQDGIRQGKDPYMDPYDYNLPTWSSPGQVVTV